MRALTALDVEWAFPPQLRPSGIRDAAAHVGGMPPVPVRRHSPFAGSSHGEAEGRMRCSTHRAASVFLATASRIRGAADRALWPVRLLRRAVSGLTRRQSRWPGLRAGPAFVCAGPEAPSLYGSGCCGDGGRAPHDKASKAVSRGETPRLD